MQVFLLKIFWWTVRESDSHLPDANRMHYHYANGPTQTLLSLLYFPPPNKGAKGLTIKPKAPNIYRREKMIKINPSKRYIDFYHLLSSIYVWRFWLYCQPLSPLVRRREIE